MNNMKKALALVLSMALAASTLVAGAAYSDVTANHDNSVAINLLGDLGVMVGDAETGNFRPEGTLNRAEAAAIVFRLRTAKTNADNYIGTTKFADVTANHWAAGYINYAETQGIINGYPDGSFKPDQKVTYAEFTKMVVSALNLQKVKTTSILVGNVLQEQTTVITGYPTGFIAIADDQRINDGITLSQDDPADRASVAQMAYNAIFEADYLKVIGSTEDPKKLSTEVFKLADVKGIVTAFEAFGTDGTSVGDDTIKILGSNEEYKFKGLTKDIVGKEVTVYTKTTGEKNVLAVVPTEKNTTITVNARDLKKDTSNNGLYYVDSTGAKKYINTITKENVLLNGKVVATTFDAIYADIAEKKIPATITFVDNNDSVKSAEYVKIDVYATAKIDTLETKYMYLSSVANPVNMISDGTNNATYNAAYNAAYEAAGKKIERIKSDDSTNKKLKIYDNAAVKDDVLVYMDINGTIEVMKIESVEGTVTEQSGDNTFVVGGKEYATTNQAAATNLSNAVGKTIKIKVDPIFGLVVNTDTVAAATTDYYFVEVVYKDQNASGKITYKADIYNNKGEKESLTIKDTSVDGQDFEARLTGLGLTETQITALQATGTVAQPMATSIVKKDSSNNIKFASATAKDIKTTFNNKDGYNSRTKLLSTAGKSAKMTDNTVVFVVKTTGEGYVDKISTFIGQFPSVSAANNAAVPVIIDTDGSTSNALVMTITGDAKGASTATSDVFGYVLKATKYSLADSKGYIEYKLLTQGEIKTIKTEIDDISDINSKPTAKNTMIQFNLTNDNLIVVDDTLAVVAGAAVVTPDNSATGTLYTGFIDTDGVDKDYAFINVEGKTYELAENAKVYVIESNIDDSRVGTTSSLSNPTSANNIKVRFTVDNDESINTIYVEKISVDAATKKIDKELETVKATTLLSGTTVFDLDDAATVTATSDATAQYTVTVETGNKVTVSYVADGTANITVNVTIDNVTKSKTVEFKNAQA